MVEDPSTLCFQNANGAHFTPRMCLCYRYRPHSQDRKVEVYRTHPKFSVIEKEYAGRPGSDIPPDLYKKLMVAIHGKENPQCPIEDPHAPINPSTNCE